MMEAKSSELYVLGLNCKMNWYNIYIQKQTKPLME